MEAEESKYTTPRVGLSSPMAKAPSPREVLRWREVVAPPVVVEVESLEERGNLEVARGLPEVVVVGDLFLIGKRFGLALPVRVMLVRRTLTGMLRTTSRLKKMVVRSRGMRRLRKLWSKGVLRTLLRRRPSHTVRADEYEEFDQDAYFPMPRQEPYRPARLVPIDGPDGEPDGFFDSIGPIRGQNVC